MNSQLFWVLSVAALIGAANAHAQETQPQLDDAARAAVVQSAAEALRQRYVFPDVGNRAADEIETALAAGRYAQVAEPREFAQRLTDELRNVTQDKHVEISVRSFAQPASASTAPPEPLRNEWGIVRADRLPDNIGYIEIVSFPELELFQPPLDRAMAALANTRALIIDARRHGGGGALSEAYLASYFLDGEERMVNKFISRNAGTETFRTQEFWSSPTPLSYAGKPVYVLTSSSTFSGGEALAYDMRALELAVVVGEVTAGGANPGGMVSLGLDFSMFVPSGRGENPVTGTNWQNVGVVPDVPTSAADALKIALVQLGLSPNHTQINELSEAALFEPRTAPQPGSEAAIRRVADELARGEPRYELMTEGRARQTRERLTVLQERFEEIGPVESMRFLEVDAQGADRYDVTHTNGSLIWGIALDKNGRIATFGTLRPAPAP